MVEGLAPGAAEMLVLIIFPFRCSKCINVDNVLRQKRWAYKKNKQTKKDFSLPCSCLVGETDNDTTWTGAVHNRQGPHQVTKGKLDQAVSAHTVCHFCKIEDVFLLIHSWLRKYFLVLCCSDNFTSVIVSRYLQF